MVDPGSAGAVSSEIEAPPTPSIADGQLHRLDPRFVQLEQQSGWIGTGVMALLSLPALLLFLWFVRPPSWLAILAAATVSAGLGALAWFNHRWPAIAYEHASYRVDAEGLEIRRGVYFRVVINVPRSRVQHIDVSQGPIERRYELGTLIIYTAGTEHAKVELEGLEHGRALRIREHLLPSGAGDAV